MAHPHTWQYDEMKQIGKDYGDIAEVEAYDAQHGNLRDLQKESRSILDRLAVRTDHVMLEMGAGTGSFAVEAAKRCSKVFAVDISHAMLEYAKKKAESQGIENIVYCPGGFLTYSHSDEPVDVIVASLALHYLPDFWKFAALNRINAILKDQGRLYVMDVVFSDEDYEKNIAKWIADIERVAGDEMAEDVRMHIQKEYSTFIWIMEGLLSQAGFRIDQSNYRDGVLAEYFCTKINSSG